MADVKISGLPASTTPLAGTEVLPIVQSGVTKQVSVANLTDGRAIAAASAIISANSTTDALRITQIGTGNALLVEDSANPDATPVVIDASGSVIQGTTTSSSTIATYSSQLQQHSSSNAIVGIGLFNWSTGTGARGDIAFLKSLSGTIGTLSAVSAGVDLGGLTFFGAGDASTWVRAANILAEADSGTFSATSMPGRLVFSTTADGASSPTERIRIDQAGRVGIGSTSLGGYRVRVGGVFETTGTIGLAVSADTTIPSNVTSNAYGFNSAINTAASAFTLAILHHYRASGQTLGAGSTVTSQYGFHADNGLTGATNNYGFYSNIASGTGRWNFFANGTANNYFAGSVGIGTTTLTGINLRVSGDLTGATATQGIRVDNVVQSDSTSTAIGVYTTLGTAAAAFTVGNLYQNRAEQGTFGAGSTVTNQYGYLAGSSLTGATNNYGFYSNIASGTNRFNFYAAGTAANYFAGDMQLDKTVTAGGTTGAQTINKNAGTVNFAAAATSLVVTDSRVTTSSIIICTVGTNDTTLKSVAAVAGAGSFTLHANAAATAETRVNFLIIN